MNARILIVEDEEILALGTESILREIGWTVTGRVSTGQEAMASIHSDPPDLVLMDICLGPGEDGVEIALRIGEEHRIPVVFLTAFADEATLRRAKLASPLGYVVKPFEQDELQAAIEVALYNHAIGQRLRAGEENRLLLGKLESAALLAGGIAHDFNNLLAAILMNIEMARACDGLPHEAEDFLAEAARATDAAADLVARITALRPHDGGTRSTGDLGAILRESAQPEFGFSGCHPEVFVSENLWPVEFDARQISQVVRNLVANAVEAGSPSVTVRADNITLAEGNPSLLPAGKYVRIRVSDHGTGIPLGSLPKIFDPYFSTKIRGSQKGVGLGLTICLDIVRKHGGAITVESPPESGATFDVFLPALALR